MSVTLSHVLANLLLSFRTIDQGRGTLQSSGKTMFIFVSPLTFSRRKKILGVKIKQNHFVSCPGSAQFTGRQSPVFEFKRPQPQSTRVQAFADDDFSDFDED